MLTIFKNKLLLISVFLCFNCYSTEKQKIKAELYLYPEGTLNNVKLDFSLSPLNDHYYEITSQLDSALEKYAVQKKSSIACNYLYRHSRLDSIYQLLICLDEYETKLIISNRDMSDFNTVALQGGDGENFIEVKSRFLNNDTLEKTMIEGFYTMTEPDTMHIEKKIISRIELNFNGEIKENVIDSAFNIITVLDE